MIYIFGPHDRTYGLDIFTSFIMGFDAMTIRFAMNLWAEVMAIQIF